MEEVFTCPIHVDLSTGGGSVHLPNSRWFVNRWRKCSPAQFTLICQQVEEVFTCPIHVEFSADGGGVHLPYSHWFVDRWRRCSPTQFTLICQQWRCSSAQFMLICRQVEEFTCPIHVDLLTGRGGVYLCNAQCMWLRTGSCYVDRYRRCSPAQFTLMCRKVEEVFNCPIHVDMSTDGGCVHLSSAQSVWLQTGDCYVER